MAEAEQKKKRTFRKFTYGGVDLDRLLNMSYEQLIQLYRARQGQRLKGARPGEEAALNAEAPAQNQEGATTPPPMENPEVVKTHLRDMIIPPEMMGVYNGKTFDQVEIKPEMIGHYLGEFSITYKPVKHGQPGIKATHSSPFIPLK